MELSNLIYRLAKLVPMCHLGNAEHLLVDLQIIQYDS